MGSNNTASSYLFVITSTPCVNAQPEHMAYVVGWEGNAPIWSDPQIARKVCGDRGRVTTIRFEGRVCWYIVKD